MPFWLIYLSHEELIYSDGAQKELKEQSENEIQKKEREIITNQNANSENKLTKSTKSNFPAVSKNHADTPNPNPLPVKNHHKTRKALQEYQMDDALKYAEEGHKRLIRSSLQAIVDSLNQNPLPVEEDNESESEEEEEEEAKSEEESLEENLKDFVAKSMEEKGRVILRPPLGKDIFCCYECTELMNQVTMQNELDLKQWRIDYLIVKQNCCYRYFGCCKKDDKKPKLFPDACSEDKIRALHARGDAPIEMKISAEVRREYNLYHNPNVRQEMKNAQAAQMENIRKNIKMQIDTVEMLKLKKQLKNQTNYTWKEKWDPKMKFQEAGYLGQYPYVGSVAEANTSPIM